MQLLARRLLVDSAAVHRRLADLAAVEEA